MGIFGTTLAVKTIKIEKIFFEPMFVEESIVFYEYSAKKNGKNQFLFVFYRFSEQGCERVPTTKTTHAIWLSKQLESQFSLDPGISWTTFRPVLFVGRLSPFLFVDLLSVNLFAHLVRSNS